MIVTKVGAVRGTDGSWNPAQSPTELRQAVYDNLSNLGVDAIDVVNLRLWGEQPSECSLAERLSVLVRTGY